MPSLGPIFFAFWTAVHSQTSHRCFYLDTLGHVAIFAKLSGSQTHEYPHLPSEYRPLKKLPASSCCVYWRKAAGWLSTPTIYSIVMTALKRTVPFIIASARNCQSRKDLGVTGCTKSVVGFRQWELLHHAIDVLQLGECDRLLRVSSMATRPGLDRQSVANLAPDQLCFARKSMSGSIIP